MKKFKSIFVLFISLLLTIGFALNVVAESPNTSFTYDLSNNPIAAPEAAQFCTNISGESLGIGNLTEPTDISSDREGNIYIVDKGNNRIIKTDKYGRFISQISSFKNGVKNDTFSFPEGITVTNNGDLYICDTVNERIVHLDKNFKLVRIISSPKNPALGSEFIFTPISIAVDNLGRIYVVSRNFNSGIVELTTEGEFNQIYGSVKTQISADEIIWRMFSTKAQRERSESIVPNEYSSVCADEKNFIYACSAFYDSTSGSSETVKKLNALGKNVLKDIPNQNITLYSKGTYGGSETYVDICTVSSGIYALLDNTRGRVFAYNDDGDLLFEFGGKGDYNSTFGTVSAFTYFDGYFYIADSRNDVISVFSLTEYAKKYIDAATFHKAGDYENENKIWKEIFSLNNNSICTIRNFGRVNFREKNYKEAMQYFKLANDRESYSEAYSAYRKIFINEHFSLIFISVIVLVILLIALLVYNSKRKKKLENKFSYIATLKYSTKVIFRPMSGFWDMKKEKYGSTAAAVSILIAVAIMFALFNSLKGYIFTTGIEGASFVLSFLTVMVPFFMFVICNWCVSSLMNGEGSFKYIFMGTAYSLTPMLIMLPILLVVSQFLTNDERSIYVLLMSIMLVWTVMLVVCSNMQVHSYLMSTTILVIIITLVVMVAVLFLAMLIFAIAQEMIGVASDMINELYLRR